MATAQNDRSRDGRAGAGDPGTGRLLAGDALAAVVAVGLTSSVTLGLVHYIVGRTCKAGPFGLPGTLMGALALVAAALVLLTVRVWLAGRRRAGPALARRRAAILVLTVIVVAALWFLDAPWLTGCLERAFWGRIQPNVQPAALRAWRSGLSVSRRVSVEPEHWPPCIRRLEPDWAFVNFDGTTELWWEAGGRDLFKLIVGPASMQTPEPDDWETIAPIQPGVYVVYRIGYR